MALLFQMKFVKEVSGILFHSVGVTLKAPPNLQATFKALLSIVKLIKLNKKC